ncbi:hypothetical protein C8R43DRAFT_952401 [Mycena crocata]|nr:hypothetical protein C8R43DRAFT_952401 [Mycena crocata]
MSSSWSPAHPLGYLGSPQHKRREHAEAQRRYRERNLEATRLAARERMAKLRAKITTPAQIAAAAEKRRSLDADFRELKRRRKFVAKHGHDAFMRVYWPQYQIRGATHLPGVRFDMEEEPTKTKARKKSKRA